MTPQTQKQIKAGSILAVVLIILHFAPAIIRASLLHGYPAPAAVIPPPALTIPPQKPDPLPSPLPLDAQAKFIGVWDGKNVSATNDVCSVHLELRLLPSQPGKVAGYETRACFDTAKYLGGTGPKGSMIDVLKNHSPVATVMTGSLSQDDLVFQVNRNIGESTAQCPITSYAVSPFGTGAVVIQWRAVGCADGQMVLVRGRG
jgi:hypothetical protein